MKRAVIGVTPLWDDSRDSIWMLPGYLDLIREAGGLPLIFPLKCSPSDVEQLCSMCDGLLLTGGDDVAPALYGEPRSAECGASNPTRDSLEQEVFRYAIEHDMPTLGICRGIQFINAVCGGTLYQDLPSEHPSAVCHQMSPPYDRESHRVTILEDTPLAALLAVSEIGVNSYHHQAVRALAPSLQPMALSEDGLIEAIYMPSKRFVWAVQWHPEFNFLKEPSSLKIAERFVAHCRD